jgi:hypothetical protein
VDEGEGGGNNNWEKKNKLKRRKKWEEELNKASVCWDYEEINLLETKRFLNTI